MAVAQITRKSQSRRSGSAPSLVQVTDLTGGLDRRVAATLLKPNRARRLRNVRVSVVGEWQPRPGWSDWLQTSMGDGRAQGAQRVYLDGVTPFTLAAHGGNVYKPTDAGVRGSAVVTGLSETEPIFFPFDAELAAVFDGVNVPQKTVDGSTWTQMGITPPVAPSATKAAGGSLTDGHEYEVSATYADDDLATESNESAVDTVTVSGTDLKIEVAVDFSDDPQVDTINVYCRDVTAGESVRRFAGTVANPGSGTATVTITENDWSEETEAPTRKNVPPALAFGVPWKNRWWAVDAIDRTLLRFTEIFENQSWPTLYYIQIPFTRGDEIAATIPLGDVLVVFGKSKQAFLIIGQTSLDFEVRPSAAVEAGALGQRAVDIVEQGVIHAAPQGVYLFDGAADRLLSNDLEFDWRAMIAAASESELASLPLVYHRRDKELRIAVPNVPAYGTAGEFVLDLARTRINDVPAWVTTDRNLGGYVQWDGVESTTGNQGRLFSWADDAGTMAEESTGTDADGSDMTVDYEGPVFSTGLTMARFLQCYVEFEPNDGTFGLEIKADGVTVVQPSITISGGIATYGTAKYGTDAYGARTRVMVPIELPIEAEGRNVQVIGQYVGQAAFKWFGYGLTMLPEPEIRGF